MADDDRLRLPLAALAAALRAGEARPSELVEFLLARIEATDGVFRAYTTVDAEGARRQARRCEAELRAGRDRGPLHGLPVAVKDLLDTRGLRTTYGSPIFEGHVPTRDAAVVSRLRRAGAIILGKTNTHEFALGGITPPTRNPWDPRRIPGGSSGGSAAALAAGSALAAIGSDTGGSIRIPASYCGVVGLKPTFGLVSRWGVFPESWSLDHVGPMARYVEDTALLLEAIAGFDGRDPASLRPRRSAYRAALGEPVEGLRVGVPANHFFDHLDGEVEAAVRGALRHLEGLGLEIGEFAFPHVDEILGAYTALDLGEIAANHRRLYAEHGGRYLPETKLMIESALFVRAATYVDALRARPRLLARVLEAMAPFDVIATPTQPIVAPLVGATVAEEGEHREDLLLAMVRLLAPFNLTGLPALSLPCGFSSRGLPIGLQIVGKPLGEAEVLRVAHAYERSTPWHERSPPPPGFPPGPANAG